MTISGLSEVWQAFRSSVGEILLDASYRTLIGAPTGNGNAVAARHRNTTTLTEISCVNKSSCLSEILDIWSHNNHHKFSESLSVCMLIVDMLTYCVSYFKSNDRLLGLLRSSDRSLVERDISLGWKPPIRTMPSGVAQLTREDLCGLEARTWDSHHFPPLNRKQLELVLQVTSGGSRENTLKIYYNQMPNMARETSVKVSF